MFLGGVMDMTDLILKKKLIFMDMIDANLQDILYLVMRQKGLSISSGCQRLLLNTYVPL